MNWSEKQPEYGDIIRVKVKFYYHYGIFIDQNRVVQFGMPDNSGTDPDKIEVLVTDIYTFLNGGNLETAELSSKERRQRRSPEDTVSFALSRVGERGYNILHNNCEHFVNQCVFGKSQSSFLEEARKGIRKKLRKD